MTEDVRTTRIARNARTVAPSLSLDALLCLDWHVAQAEGWIDAETFHGYDKGPDEDGSLAYERFLESRCDDEYAIIERDAPWAL